MNFISGGMITSYQKHCNMVTQRQLKKYTEAVENAYPGGKDFIQGELSTIDYIHIIMVATDVLLSRDKLQIGGHFVQAIVDNKLYETYARADSVCERAIKFFLYCKDSIRVE